MKHLGLALVFLAPLAGAQGAELLGSGDVVILTGAGSFSPEARVSILFTSTGAFGAPGPGFRFTIRRSNPNIAGFTEVLDASDGPVFFDAVRLLTNGRLGFVNEQVVFPGAGGSLGATGENAYFEYSGLACWNGIDFAGAQIERIELRVSSSSFETGPGGAASSLRLQGVLSVFGIDTTCAASAARAGGRGARAFGDARPTSELRRRSSHARRAD
jgi:hypothetical protein